MLKSALAQALVSLCVFGLLCGCRALWRGDRPPAAQSDDHSYNVFERKGKWVATRVGPPFWWWEFALFSAVGDLAFRREQLIDKLTESGILFEAKIGVGDGTADEVVARLMPSSAALQSRFASYLARSRSDDRVSRFAMAQAHMAVRFGAPLHIAEAARIARVPFILSSFEGRYLQGYESETLRVRKVSHRRVAGQVECWREEGVDAAGGPWCVSAGQDTSSM